MSVKACSPPSRLAQLLSGSRDIGLVPWRDQCQVNIGRRNKSNWKVFQRLDQSGELLCNVRSNLDADEYANGLDGNIGTHHGSDGGLHGARRQSLLAGRLHSRGRMGVRGCACVR